LLQLWREMKSGVGYCSMVTITTSGPQETLNYRNGVGAEWPFLADPGRIVQRDLDIAEYTNTCPVTRAEPGSVWARRLAVRRGTW
jgi:hypothetical protein